MKIECFDKEIASVFEGFYRIPRFQRPYSWEREHIEEFWNDTISEQEADYFIGSIVLFKDKGVYGIVDGQQRLTTVTMMLAALRNVFRGNDFEDYAKGVHNLIERHDINNQQIYVLRSESSYPYLPEFIQKWGKPSIEPTIGPEEHLLKDGFDYITEQFDAVVQSVKNDPSLSKTKKHEKLKNKLLEIRDKLLQLKVIYTVLDNEDDAYIIFETLNTRGKDLTISDLIKNLLTRLIKQPNKGVDTTRDKWNKVLETFEASSVPISVNSFLHHYWLSKYEYTTEKKLYKAIKKTLHKNNAEQFLNTLVEQSHNYRSLYEPGYAKWSKEESELRDALVAMNLFKVRQQIPMTLSVVSNHAIENLKTKHAREILSAIENFHFAFTAIASQRSSGGISFMYASAGRSLNAAKTQDERLEALSGLKKKLKERLPSLSEFEARFTELRCSSKFTKQRDLVRYVLAGIAQHNANGLAIDTDEMTIEHLGSQNAKKPTLSDEETASIGNLLFVTKDMNGKLKNKPFSEKKAMLLKSNVWVDDVIKESNEWGPEQVAKRGSALAKLAYEKVWKL